MFSRQQLGTPYGGWVAFPPLYQRIVKDSRTFRTERSGWKKEKGVLQFAARPFYRKRYPP